MATQVLKAVKRDTLGRKVARLRKEGVLPANIYGKKMESVAVQLPVVDFQKTFAEVGETGLLELQVDKKTYPVLIHNVQRDSVTEQLLHADFHQVDLKEKITATVPVEFVGESPVEKSGEGIIVHQMNEVEVEALPADLPEKFTVDISGLLKVEDSIKVGELSIDKKKVEVKDDLERIVVSVAPPAKEEVVAPPVPAEGEEGAVPVEGEAAPGETPAEGAPAPEGGAPTAEGGKKSEEGKAEGKPEEKPQEHKQ